MARNPFFTRGNLIPFLRHKFSPRKADSKILSQNHDDLITPSFENVVYRWIADERHEQGRIVSVGFGMSSSAGGGTEDIKSATLFIFRSETDFTLVGGGAIEEHPLTQVFTSGDLITTDIDYTLINGRALYRHIFPNQSRLFKLLYGDLIEFQVTYDGGGQFVSPYAFVEINHRKV